MANAVCASAAGRAAALSRPSDFDTNPRAARTYLVKLTAVRQAEVSSLHLNPPDQIRAAYVRFYGSLLRGQLLLILATGAASTGQHSYPQSYARAVEFGQKVVEPMAHKLGFTSCPG